MQQQIERYLRGEMSASESAAFKAQTLKDPALAAELAFQEQLFRELGDAPKQQFVALTDTIADAYFGAPPAVSAPTAFRKYITPVVALIFIGGALGWYFSQKKSDHLLSKTSNSTIEGNNTGSVVTAPSNLPDADTKTEQNAGTKPEQAVDNAAQPTAKDLPKTSASKDNQSVATNTDNRPEFQPNAHWETLIGKKLVAAEYDIRANAKMAKSRELTFKVNMKWPEVETPAPMVVAFYSNSDQDRISQTPLKRVTLNLLSQVAGQDQSGKKTYSLDYTAGVNWKPGLYYYVISFENDEKPILVGKFQ